MYVNFCFTWSFFGNPLQIEITSNAEVPARLWSRAGMQWSYVALKFKKTKKKRREPETWTEVKKKKEKKKSRTSPEVRMSLIKAQCVFRSQTIDRGPRQNNCNTHEENSCFKRKKNKSNKIRVLRKKIEFFRSKAVGKVVQEKKNYDLHAKRLNFMTKWSWHNELIALVVKVQKINNPNGTF